MKLNRKSIITSIIILAAFVLAYIYILAPRFSSPFVAEQTIPQVSIPEIPPSLRHPAPTGNVGDMGTLLLNETDVDTGIFTSELGDENVIKSDTKEINNLDHVYDETQL